MPSDDELRRVAEDMRALARSLARDIRNAVEQGRDDEQGPGAGRGPRSNERRSAREDFADAGRAARREFRRAQQAFRRSAHQRHAHGPTPPGSEGAEGADDIGTSSGPGLWSGSGWGSSWGTGWGSGSGSGSGYPPRWDNWGRQPRRRQDWARVGAWGGPSGTPPAPGEADAHRTRASRPPRAQVAVPVPPRAPKPVPVPPPPVRHRHDGSTLLGLLAVVFGLAWLAAGTHVARVSTVAVVAIALMVVGAATVVTARTDWALSRRSWPVVGGAALVAALVAFSVSPNLPVGFQHLSFGSRTIAPATWAELPSTIHGGFGRTVIDLTGLAGPPPVARTLAVDDAAGQIEITLPSTFTVVVDAAVAAGQINVNGQSLSGVKRSITETLNPGTLVPALTIRVRSGFGNTVVGPAGALATKPVPATPDATTPDGAADLFPSPTAPKAPATPPTVKQP